MSFNMLKTLKDLYSSDLSTGLKQE